MDRTQINERNQLPVTITLKLNDVLTAPSTLRWKLDCITSGTSDVVAWTTLGAASTVSLTIPASANVIVSNVNLLETKRITVQANYDTTQEISTFLDYDVLNNSACT